MNLSFLAAVTKLTAEQFFFSGDKIDCTDVHAVELRVDEQGRIVLLMPLGDGYQHAIIEHEPVDPALRECELLRLLEGE